jgi:hypothetical protein
MATFNSRLKSSERRGGFYLDGVTTAPLPDGKASAVIGDHGHLTVGQGPRRPHARARRCCTAELRDVGNGRPMAGLDRDADGR